MSPRILSLAGISVWKHIDTDGDLDTFEDEVSPPSWEFQAAFEEGVEIVCLGPGHRSGRAAGWLIGHAGDSTHVVVTEVPQNGYRLVKASCFDAESDFGAEIPTSLDGNSLSFDVSGFSPTAPWLMRTTATSGTFQWARPLCPPCPDRRGRRF